VSQTQAIEQTPKSEWENYFWYFLITWKWILCGTISLTDTKKCKMKLFLHFLEIKIKIDPKGRCGMKPSDAGSQKCVWWPNHNFIFSMCLHFHQEVSSSLLAYTSLGIPHPLTIASTSVAKLVSTTLANTEVVVGDVKHHLSCFIERETL